MRNSARVAIAFVGASALMGATIGPTAAATSTTTTEVLGGSISITVPESVTMSSVKPGVTSTATVSAVTVDDQRAGTTGWTATAQITDFTAGTVTTAEGGPKATIAASHATYAPGAASTTGTVTVTASAAQPMGGAAEVVTQTATGVHGNNTATWDSTLSLTVPSDALADTYSATLTQSAA